MENNTAVKPLQPENGVGPLKPTYADLTASQKQRVAYLRGIYTGEEDALKLITLLEPRGENSWKKVNDKITSISQDDYKIQQYADAIYDYFELGAIYTSDDVVSAIGDVRRSLNLSPYMASLKRNCENDFLRLFIVKFVDLRTKDQIDNDEKKIIGFQPMFKLKPQD